MPTKHPETGAFVYDCPRCGNTINPDGRPVEATDARYVEADTERNPVETEIAIALQHTEQTRAVRDAMKDEHSLTTAEANMALAQGNMVYAPREAAVADVPASAAPTSGGDERVMPSKDDYDRVEDVDPSAANADPDVIQVVGETVSIDAPAQLIVCPECFRTGDTVIWAGAAVKE